MATTVVPPRTSAVLIVLPLFSSRGMPLYEEAL